MNQATNRFVEKVAYISCPGDRVKTVVSDFGIFEKTGDDSDLILTGCLTNPEIPAQDDPIQAIKNKCGWALKVSPFLEVIPGPDQEELMVLRTFDPKGYFRV